MTGDVDGSRQRRAELRDFLGVRNRPTPRTHVLASWERNGFRLHRVELVTDDDTIPALLAVPHGEGPFPAVIVFHQHAGQRHLGKSEVFGIDGDPHQAFGPALAQAGCVVLAPDSICFEDRRPGGPGTDPRGDDWDQHYNAMAYRLVAGDTLMRTILEDSMAAVSALLDRTDVDHTRVATLGHSYGGNTSLFLTAIDDRVRSGCASGALASFRRKIDDGTGIEMAEVIPGFTTRFEMNDIVAAISPRPYLVVSATADKYSADAQDVIDAASEAGVPSISHIRVDGGHALDAERFTMIMDWMIQSFSSPE